MLNQVFDFRYRGITDAEYVARVRRDLGLRRWLWVPLLLVSVLAVALVTAFLMLVVEIVQFPGAAMPLWPALLGFAFGLLMGAAVGMKVGILIVASIESLFIWLRGDRTSELLVKYYDALATLATTDAQPTER